MGRASILTRIRKLEALVPTSAGLVALSSEWFTFWSDRIKRLVAGEAPERIGRIPIEVIDQMRGQAHGGTPVAGVMQD
jgi:hypothetical protein